MKWKVWLAVLTVVLICLGTGGALLLHNLPTLVESQLRRYLSTSGVEDFSLGEAYLGISGAGTDQISIRGRFEDWAYTVTATGVVADYHWSLLLDGEVESLSIAGVTAKIESVSGEESAPASTALDIDAWIKQLEALSLPVAGLTLEVLDLAVALPVADFSVHGKELGLTRATKTTMGSLTLENLRLPGADLEGDAFPPVALALMPGSLPWVPDIRVAVESGRESVLVSNLALVRAPPDGNSYQLRLAGELNSADLWRDILPLKQLWPQLREWETYVQPTALSAQWQVVAAVPNTLSPDNVAALSWQGSSRVELDSAGQMAQGIRSLSLSAQVEAQGNLKQWTVRATEPIQADLALDPRQFGADDGEESWPLAVLVSIDEPLNMAPDGLVGAAHLNLAIDLNSPSVPDQLSKAGLESASLLAQVVVARQGRDWQLEFPQGASLAGVGYPLQWGVPALVLPGKGKTAFSIHVQPSAPLVLFGSRPNDDAIGSLAGATVNAILGDETVAAPLEASGDFSGVVFGLDTFSLASTVTLGIPLDGKPLPPLTMVLALNRASGRWQGNGNLTWPGLSLAGRGSMRLSETGDVEIRGKMAADNLPALFEQGSIYLQPLRSVAKDVALAAGSGGLDVSLSQRGAVTQVIFDASAKDLAGIGFGVAFSQGRLSGGVKLHQQGGEQLWFSTEPLDIAIDRLSTGVQANNAHLQLALTPSPSLSRTRWRVEKVHAELFGGELSLGEPAVVDYPFDGNRMMFKLSNLRLEQILGLYREQGVNGTGVLNGEIPVILENGGVRIDRGRLLAASPGGHLSFTGAKSISESVSNAQLATTLKLLEDFNYEVLNVSTTLEPEGRLLLAVRLQGNNPSQFDGRPVNFNINLEENIFQLFKVLKLTDDITTKLEKRLGQDR